LAGLLLAAPLAAETIDVTASNSTTLATGNTLLVTFLTKGIASALNYSPSGVALYFSLETSAAPAGTELGASLASDNGAYAASMAGTMSLASGSYTTNSLSVPVSVYSGRLLLTQAQAQALVDAGTATLTLENLGPDVLLGLTSQSTIAQEVNVGVSSSLSGSTRSSGLMTLSVQLDPPSSGAAGSTAQALRGVVVPEPGTAALFGLGAGLLGLGLVWRRRTGEGARQ
jgi:hypothetical protein